MIINNISELIGNTPLLKIPKSVHKVPNLNLYCKLEFRNAFGSIKDRAALNMIKDNIKDCQKNNKTVLEASSGNTARALSLLSSINNLKFKTITNRIKTPEIKKHLRLFNAEIQELPGISECPDPNNPEDYMVIAKNLAEKNPNTIFYTDQYFSNKNPDAHKKTGEELCNDLDKIDYFLPILGTAGSATGIGNVLKEKRNSKVIGIVADQENYVPGGRNINEMWEVGFYKKSFYDEILSGSVDEAVEGNLELIRKVGILCGPTTGLAYKKTKDYFNTNKPTSEVNAVFIACDGFEQYLSYYDKFSPNLIDKKSKKGLYESICNAPDDSIKEISAEKLKEEINDVTIIDIRSKKSFEMINLPNSINIPEHEIDSYFENSIPFSKNRKLVVVCNKGIRSKKLAKLLNENGYISESLKDGIYSWNFNK